MEFQKTVLPEGGWKIDVIVNGESTSHLYVWDMLIRVADARIRSGGIGGVETPYKHRMQGFGRVLLEETVRFMTQERLAMSFLFGIPGFYHKYGYAPALVGCETSIATRDAEVAQKYYAVRAFHAEDAPRMVELYEKQNGTRTGTVPRNPATWKGIRMVPFWNDRVRVFVVESEGQVVGYAAHNYSLDDLVVGEIGYATPAVFSTLLSHLAAIANERRVETIKIYAPFDEPFIVWCRRFGCTNHLTYPRWGAGMGRIIDQQKLFGALMPVMQQRLTKLPHLADSTLLLKTELGETRLVFGSGHQQVNVGLPQSVLTQLVMGYRSVSDVVSEVGTIIDATGLEVMDALFPPGFPEMWTSDNF